MNLKEKLQNIMSENDSDSEIYVEAKKLLNQHNRLIRERKSYDFNLILNSPKVNNLRHLSHSINIKGRSKRAIYEKLSNIKKVGFSSSKQDKVLTEKICNYINCTKENLIKNFQDEE